MVCSALVGTPSLHKHPVACALQELSILERLPFDRRVVQLYGSCTQEGNVLLVLEFVQVRLPLLDLLLVVQLRTATGHNDCLHMFVLHAWQRQNSKSGARQADSDTVVD